MILEASFTEANTELDSDFGEVFVVQGEGGSLSSTASELLITILRNAVYSTDQSENITALEAALASNDDSGSGDEPDVPVTPDEPDEPVVVTYTITSGLTNVESSNVSSIVNEGANYTATLTAIDGYEIESVIVTMGGVDITASAYADGVVSIASVTGDVVITANAVEVVEEDDINNGWVDGEAYTVEWIADTALDNSTGAEKTASGNSLSGYMPCAGASVIDVGTGIYTSYGIWFYDAEKTFLLRPTYPANYNSRYIGVPHGAYFVRFYRKTTSASNIEVTPRVIDSLNATTVAESGKVYVADWDYNTNFNTSTGAIIENATNHITKPMLVYGFGAIQCQINARSWYAFYDADMNFIQTTVKQNQTGAIAIPTNAMYVRWSIGDAKSNPCFYLLEDVWCVDMALTQTTATNYTPYPYSVTKGESYTTTLTAKSGYVLSSVTVTMGGVDITDTVYADGVVTIPSVTSHVKITAVSVAEEA